MKRRQEEIRESILFVQPFDNEVDERIPISIKACGTTRRQFTKWLKNTVTLERLSKPSQVSNKYTPLIHTILLDQNIGVQGVVLFLDHIELLCLDDVEFKRLLNIYDGNPKLHFTNVLYDLLAQNYLILYQNHVPRICVDEMHVQDRRYFLLEYLLHKGANPNQVIRHNMHDYSIHKVPKDSSLLSYAIGLDRAGQTGYALPRAYYSGLLNPKEQVDNLMDVIQKMIKNTQLLITYGAQLLPGEQKEIQVAIENIKNIAYGPSIVQQKACEEASKPLVFCLRLLFDIKRAINTLRILRTTASRTTASTKHKIVHHLVMRTVWADKFNRLPSFVTRRTGFFKTRCNFVEYLLNNKDI